MGIDNPRVPADAGTVEINQESDGMTAEAIADNGSQENINLLETPTDQITDLFRAYDLLPDGIRSQIHSGGVYSMENKIKIAVDAYKIAESLKTNNPENKSPDTLVNEFFAMPPEEQDQSVPGLIYHSGSSLGGACEMAKIYLIRS